MNDGEKRRQKGENRKGKFDRDVEAQSAGSNAGTGEVGGKKRRGVSGGGRKTKSRKEKRLRKSRAVRSRSPEKCLERPHSVGTSRADTKSKRHALRPSLGVRSRCCRSGAGPQLQARLVVGAAEPSPWWRRIAAPGLSGELSRVPRLVRGRAAEAGGAPRANLETPESDGRTRGPTGTPGSLCKEKENENEGKQL
ncbi:hypothetical protein P7K49_021107 [Saguinus oedipus]|uniref:Uncharacterized protein n=1 Tax=Saguinus oedipus TaxID=9490 RepID=A0ABQ9USE4_SAGOE|nr:hypothetical protein P7K49_021107 [Saguinus oedipus]